MAAAYTLYGSFLSSPTYKVGLMLSLCGLPFDYRHIDLAKRQQKSPDFLAINRYGQVPAIAHEGRYLCQANTILEYIAEQTGRFGGATPDERQRIREWLVWETDRLEPGINRMRFFERFAKADPAVMDYTRQHAVAGLTVLNDLLADRPFLVADAATIADISIYCIVAYMEEGKFDATDWPAVQGWMGRMAAQPGFMPPYELLPKADRDAG
jgi:glutathione S-transferase